MGKVGSMRGRVHKYIRVLMFIKLMVRDLLGRRDVEWIIVTWGGDQLQCWWTQKKPSCLLKSGTFLDLLNSCLLCKKGCAACWVMWEGAGIAEWNKWLSCEQNDKGITFWFLAGEWHFSSPHNIHTGPLEAHLAFCSVGAWGKVAGPWSQPLISV